MLDDVFLTVSDIRHSVAFYKKALAPLGIDERLALPIMAHLRFGCTMIRAAMRPTCLTRMATALSSSTRAGSTRRADPVGDADLSPLSMRVYTIR